MVKTGACYLQKAYTIEKTKSLFQLHQKEHLFLNIDWVQADIIDVPSLEIAFENVDYVYHCAALISYDPKDEDSTYEKQILKALPTL